MQNPMKVGVVPACAAVTLITPVTSLANNNAAVPDGAIVPVIAQLDAVKLFTAYFVTVHPPKSLAVDVAVNGRLVMLTLPDGEPVQPESTISNCAYIQFPMRT